MWVLPLGPLDLSSYRRGTARGGQSRALSSEWPRAVPFYRSKGHCSSHRSGMGLPALPLIHKVDLYIVLNLLEPVL